ncbi:nitrile hydratase accessory protein [Streptosporangium lutulentum]
MGLELAGDVRITIRDSSSEVRWLVLPERLRHREPVRGTARAAGHPGRDGRRGQGESAVTAPLDIEGPAAPPRSNGELVFAEPWESRAFGMAVALHEAGVFTWPRFQAALIARIAAWESAPPRARAGTTTGTGWAHWRTCWPTAASCSPRGHRARPDADPASRHHDHPDDHDHPH